MTQSLAIEGNYSSSASTDNCTRHVLDCIHELLVDSVARQWTWVDGLHQLAAAFQVRGAGLAGLLEETAVVHYHVGGHSAGAPGRWPWDDQPELLLQVQGATSALPVETEDGRTFLLAAHQQPEGARWLFWLEDQCGRAWRESERAAFSLAALALSRLLTTEVEASNWARWRGQARLEQRLEDMAVVIGRLSHDFGNVLTGIMGFTELGLAQIPKDSSVFSRIQEVYTAALEGVQFLGRLNGISQRSVRHGRPSVLADVVAEEVNRLRAAWGDAIDLQVTVPAELPPVVLDAGSLRQLLSALLANARQASKAHGRIALTACRVHATVHDCLDLLGAPRPGEYARLTVTDDGTGFSPEAQRRVFAEPFFSTKPRHRGMGLLSVYGVLRTCGGALRLEHGKESGTTVHVYLPLALRERLAPRAHLGPVPTTAKARILVVEDDLITQRLLRAMLESAGFVVETVDDGFEALDLSRKTPQPFDLYLIDVVMPRMDGLELARHLVARNRRVNILFTSGHVPEGFDKERFGGRRFRLLSKPFQTEELFRAVQGELNCPAL